MSYHCQLLRAIRTCFKIFLITNKVSTVTNYRVPKVYANFFKIWIFQVVLTLHRRVIHWVVVLTQWKGKTFWRQCISISRLKTYQHLSSSSQVPVLWPSTLHPASQAQSPKKHRKPASETQTKLKQINRIANLFIVIITINWVTRK